MKAIIFGSGGQDGFYMKQLLRRENVEAIGVSRSADIVGDVADRAFVEQMIAAERPEYIFHFAACSTTGHEAVFENHDAIATGTINILEAAYRHCPESKVFLSGSAMQFENNGTPIDEQTPFAPLSPYAASRIASVYAGRYYRSLAMRVYVGYLFNHDSPRRSPRHVNKLIADAAREGKQIQIGDISVKKEFNFAGDIMEAVWLLVNQNVVFEAVIGSGQAHKIEEWLELCFGLAGKDWREYVSETPNFKSEYRTLVSDPALIMSLRWRPKVDIGGLARIMMER